MNTPLTREIIEKATGRELDALVAEHVMGWRWMEIRSRHLAVLAEPEESYEDEQWRFATADAKPARDALRNVPAYSTTGDGMLLVMNQMAELGFTLEVSKWHRGEALARVVRFDNVHDELVYLAMENCGVPEAACRAALLAVSHLSTP
jgi:hypothetical protein